GPGASGHPPNTYPSTPFGRFENPRSHAFSIAGQVHRITPPNQGDPMMRTFLNGIALACALPATTELSAQLHSDFDEMRESTTGLIVGANFTGSFVTVGDAAVDEHGFGGRGRESGAGMHFTLGYAF